MDWFKPAGQQIFSEFMKPGPMKSVTGQQERQRVLE
jgi:hypothetical protein